MPAVVLRNTVDRLDRPSAYYAGRVSEINHSVKIASTSLTATQKKRRYNDDREEREKTPEPEEDPLKDATTLYVGNL